MGLMDNAKDMMGDMDKDSMRAKYEELRSKDEAGQLDDKGRDMMNQLREKMAN